MASRATAISDSGFTLTELAIAVAIVGILTGIALPNYFNAVQRARQSDASSQIMTILTSVQAYREEFLEVPNSWDDIAQITPVMTDNGIATGAISHRMNRMASPSCSRPDAVAHVRAQKRALLLPPLDRHAQLSAQLARVQP